MQAFCNVSPNFIKKKTENGTTTLKVYFLVVSKFICSSTTYCVEELHSVKCRAVNEVAAT